MLCEKNKPSVDKDKELKDYLKELENRSELPIRFSLAKGATIEDVKEAVEIAEKLHKK